MRNARPTDPELIARRLPDDAGALYAAPDFLKRAETRTGAPMTAETLAELDFVGIEDTAALIAALAQMGVRVSPGNFAVASGSHLVHWALVKRGLGVGVMSVRIGDAEPAVTRALPDAPTTPFPVWLVAHRELSTSRRVRLVFDLLASALGGQIEPR